MINPAAAIRRLSSSHRLYLIGGILIAATIAAACLAVWDRRAQTIKSYEREVTNLSITLAEQLARSMQAVDLVLQETQSKLAAAGVDSAAQFSRRVAAEEIHRFFAQQLSNLPQADGTALIDADGFMIASSREWPVPRLDASDRDYYVHFRDHDDRGVFISAPARTRVTGVWAFFMARRLDGPHGEFLGIVVGAIDLQYFEEFYKSITLERGGSVNILRRDGTMLARYPHVEDMMGKKLPPRARWYAAIGNGGGSFWTPGYVDGVARVVSTYRMAPLRHGRVDRGRLRSGLLCDALRRTRGWFAQHGAPGGGPGRRSWRAPEERNPVSRFRDDLIGLVLGNR